MNDDDTQRLANNNGITVRILEGKKRTRTRKKIERKNGGSTERERERKKREEKLTTMAGV